MHDNILNIGLLIFYNILAHLLHILFSFFYYLSTEICRALWLHFVYFGGHISIIASSGFLCHGLMAEFAHLHHFHIWTKKISMFSSHCYSPTVPCRIHHHSPTGQTDFTNGSWAHSWNLMKILITVILIGMMQSCHNFAHAITMALSWHVQNCVRAVCMFRRFGS